ncbi:MAG: condensation domain-containing protein, partial [Mycobacteriales bacterium]
MPDHGIGFGLLRYLNPDTGPQLAGLPPPQIGFNYLGRFPAAARGETTTSREWVLAAEQAALSGEADPTVPMAHGLELNALVCDHQDGPYLVATWSFAPQLWSEHDVEEVSQLWLQALEGLVEHASHPGAGGHTPSDFPLVTLTQHQVDHLDTTYPDLAEVLPLSPMQEGLLFHALYDLSGPDVYTLQLVFDLHGPLDALVLHAATQALWDRHPNLGAGFPRLDSGRPVQVITRHAVLPWDEIDLCGLGEAEREAKVAQLAADDYARRLDLAAPPLLRFTLIHLGPQQHRLIMATHHILLDGWSMPVLVRELFALYAHRGDTSALPRVTPYRDYLAWLAQQDHRAAEQAWRQALSGLPGPTHLAPVDPARTPILPDQITRELPEQLATALHD